jgi:hypothetical protein
VVALRRVILLETRPVHAAHPGRGRPRPCRGSCPARSITVSPAWPMLLAVDSSRLVVVASAVTISTSPGAPPTTFPWTCNSSATSPGAAGRGDHADPLVTWSAPVGGEAQLKTDVLRPASRKDCGPASTARHASWSGTVAPALRHADQARCHESLRHGHTRRSGRRPGFCGWTLAVDLHDLRLALRSAACTPRAPAAGNPSGDPVVRLQARVLPGAHTCRSAP